MRKGHSKKSQIHDNYDTSNKPASMTSSLVCQMNDRVKRTSKRLDITTDDAKWTRIMGKWKRVPEYDLSFVNGLYERSPKHIWSSNNIRREKIKS